jgi:iron complex outermembrane receptor protein
VNAIESGDPPDYIKDASFSYAINRPYQSVQHHLFKAKGYLQTGEFSRLNIIGSFQNNHRREYDIVRSPRSNPQLELSLYTTALDLAWDHYKGKYWKGTAGVSGSFQLNDINYRYFIPNYIGINTGVFIAEKYTRGNWIAEAGLRYDLRWLNNITDNDASPNDVLTGNASNPGDPYGTRSFNGFSGNAGVTYKLKRWRFNISGGSAWRSPQVNELFADGLHHGAARIEKGKTDLVPERSLGLQAELEYANEKFTLDSVNKRFGMGGGCYELRHLSMSVIR